METSQYFEDKGAYLVFKFLVTAEISILESLCKTLYYKVDHLNIFTKALPSSYIICLLSLLFYYLLILSAYIITN